MRPHDVEIFFGQLSDWLANRGKMWASRTLPAFFKAEANLRILVAGSLKRIHLLQERGGGVRSDFFFQSLECLLGGIAFGVGEGGVKGDYAGSAGAQLIDKLRVVASGKRERADLLECVFVDGYDDDAVVVRALAADFEAQIERSSFDALKEGESRVGIALQSGERKESEARQRDGDGEPEVNVTKREFCSPLRPAWLLLRLQVNSAAVGTAGLAGAIAAASAVIQAESQSHGES